MLLGLHFILINSEADLIIYTKIMGSFLTFNHTLLVIVGVQTSLRNLPPFTRCLYHLSVCAALNSEESLLMNKENRC